MNIKHIGLYIYIYIYVGNFVLTIIILINRKIIGFLCRLYTFFFSSIQKSQFNILNLKKKEILMFFNISFNKYF